MLDIRARLPESVSMADLAAVQDSEREHYPIREDMVEIRSELLGRGTELLSTAASRKVSGYRFVSENGRQIFQAQLGGFTFNRLEPYEHWAPFRQEAQRLWQVYVAAAKPHAVTRAALRYINRINVPLGAELKDYFRTVPEVAPDLPQILSSFVMHLEVPQADIDGKLLLNQATVEPAHPDMSSIVLDIDLFCEVEMQADDRSLWELFEKLRVRKNAVFEACITDRVREVIE